MSTVSNPSVTSQVGGDQEVGFHCEPIGSPVSVDVQVTLSTGETKSYRVTLINPKTNEQLTFYDGIDKIKQAISNIFPEILQNIEKQSSSFINKPFVIEGDQIRNESGSEALTADNAQKVTDIYNKILPYLPSYQEDDEDGNGDDLQSIGSKPATPVPLDTLEEDDEDGDGDNLQSIGSKPAIPVPSLDTLRKDDEAEVYHPIPDSELLPPTPLQSSLLEGDGEDDAQSVATAPPSNKGCCNRRKHQSKQDKELTYLSDDNPILQLIGGGP